MTLSDALKRFRRTLNLSQKQVTDKIGITAPQQWQKYEYGQMVPSAEIIIKTAQAFGVSADYLLGLSDEPNPRPADDVLLDRLKAMRAEIDALLEKFQ